MNMEYGITEEMKEELKRLSDELERITDEVYDDGKEEGTGGILNLCDVLYDKIEQYLCHEK